MDEVVTSECKVDLFLKYLPRAAVENHENMSAR